MKTSLEFLKTKSKQSGLEFLIHFGVRRFFDDGTSVGLTTNDQWNKLVEYNMLYEEIKLHYKKELELVINDNFKYFLKTDSSANTAFLKKLSEVGMGNSIAIYRKTPKSINAYFFTVPPFFPNAAQLLVNKISTFEKIVDQIESLNIQFTVPNILNPQQLLDTHDLAWFRKSMNKKYLPDITLNINGTVIIFTESELKLLKLLTYTTITKEMSNRLNISPKTVEWHINNIRKKTGKHSRSALSTMARQIFYTV